ncbi:flavin reductase family protein [Propionispora hippei]|uniref:NADH-FMN oxidoreductase RutF, flavin reductase (DIM6/NTAB) family n=1 Tax=Propionispora hippei DSM 15287 TaxID=1123003 RepID=A0A1M6MSB1_9FIRM|nr:flavin reductase family protein [Propionispora hippei]SHJ86280.1 NADH-FMN oxidoreductase RutF, flavin reductase (DIM6/NTAB) family [Propionispora hippei DSM 15287]
MVKEVRYNEYAKQALDMIPKGAFLTTAAGEAVNTMTIGWGAISHIWQKPVFIVLVRPSRYTYELIENSSEFTVSVPLHDDMKKALALCGTKSGRDMDKIKAAGLSVLPGQKVGVPVISGAGLHFECKIVYKQKMDPSLFDPGLAKTCYPEGDYHTLYYGEIVACYQEA